MEWLPRWTNKVGGGGSEGKEWVGYEHLGEGGFAINVYGMREIMDPYYLSGSRNYVAYFQFVEMHLFFFLCHNTLLWTYGSEFHPIFPEV